MEVLAPSDTVNAAAIVDGAQAVIPPPTPTPLARGDAAPTRASETTPLSIPPEPETLLDSGLPRAELESLILKILLQRGTCTGSVISEVACMPRSIVAETLDRIRNELLVTIKSSSGIHDYIYQLTEA